MTIFAISSSDIPDGEPFFISKLLFRFSVFQMVELPQADMHKKFDPKNSIFAWCSLPVLKGDTTQYVKNFDSKCSSLESVTTVAVHWITYAIPEVSQTQWPECFWFGR